MVNLLHFVHDLLSSTPEQLAYGQDPPGYAAAQGQADLSGEDVAEAVPVVLDLLDENLAERVDAAIGSAPSPSPEPGETPFDAACRLLDHYIAAVDGSVGSDAGG